MALTDNLVSYWKLDEASGDATDSHGSNTLTDFNTVARVSAKLNNGGDFELTNTEYLGITDGAQSGLDLTGAMSISAWITCESSTAVRVIASKKDTGSGQGYQFWIGSANDLVFSVEDAGSSSIGGAPNGSIPDDATLRHVVATFKTSGSDRVSIYINSVKQTIGSPSDGSSGATNTTASFCIGATKTSGGSTANHYDGIIDEVGIWSRELTQAEVTSLYNGGAGLAYPLATGGPPLFLLLGIGT